MKRAEERIFVPELEQAVHAPRRWRQASEACRMLYNHGWDWNYDTYFFERKSPFDNYDWCYECTGYGDDYYIDDDGELQSACEDCPHNSVGEK